MDVHLLHGQACSSSWAHGLRTRGLRSSRAGRTSRQLILGIIDNAESDIPMCPKLMQRAQASERSIYDKSTEQRFRDALERALATYSYDEIFDLAIDASAPVNGGPATAGGPGRFRPDGSQCLQSGG